MDFSLNQQQVELKIDEEDLQRKSIEILDKYSIKDFYTEKVPVEKVMKTLMQNPEILRQQWKISQNGHRQLKSPGQSILLTDSISFCRL